MTNYNPSNPNTVGLEWPATRKVSTILSGTTATGAVVAVGTSQSVDRIKLFLRTQTGQWIDTASAAYIIDVYDLNNMDPGVVKTAYSAPAADSTSSTWIRSDTGAAGARFNLVDEGPQVFSYPSGWEGVLPNAGDFIQANPTTERNARVRFKGNTNFISLDSADAPGTIVGLTGKRILDARVGAWFANTNGTGAAGRPPNPPPPQVRGLMFNGAVESVIGEANTSQPFLPTVRGQLYGVAFSMFGSAREWKNWKQPLTLVDIQTMLTTGAGSFGLAIDGQNHPVFVFECHLEVSYCEERRIATGFATELTAAGSGATDGRWVNFPLVNPLTGAAATWNKVAGSTYLIVLRQAPLTLNNNSWRALDPNFTFDHRDDVLSGVHAADVPLRDPAHIGFAGLPAFIGGFTGQPPMRLTVAPAFYLQNVTTVRSDSQPYADYGSPIISGGLILEQEFNTTGALPYGLASFLLRNDALPRSTDAPLVASIIRRSDSAGLASGSATIDDLLPGVAVDNLFHQVRIRFASVPSLVAGTQYALRLTSATTTGGYTVQYLSTTTAEAAAMSVGGTTNIFTIAGVDAPTVDLIAGLTTVPTVVTGLTSANSLHDTDRALVGSCIVPTVHYAALGWTASALGAEFQEYQIERNDDGTWFRIANIGSVVTSFRDFECRRNVSSSWRIRQVRTDGAWSDWATFPTRTITANDYECVLTSNQSADQTLGLMDEPGHHYERLASGRQVERSLYGRDKTLVFRESEDRGERFQRRFVLAWNDPTLVAFPTLSGRAVYDPLVTLLEDVTLPHVTLVDHRGRRWYTAATIQDLNHEEPNGRYFADVEFLEVAGPTPANLAFA